MKIYGIDVDDMRFMKFLHYYYNFVPKDGEKIIKLCSAIFNKYVYTGAYKRYDYSNTSHLVFYVPAVNVFGFIWVEFLKNGKIVIKEINESL